MSKATVATIKAAKHLRDVHVLVVDDDRRIAKLVRSVLNGLGFNNVYVEFTAEAALDFLDKQDVDMVICDWMMDDMSGVEMVRQLRDTKGSHNQMVPIIMLSGNSEKPLIETARDSGVTEYVMKPFTAKSLCSRIVAVIENPRSFIMSQKFSGHNRRRKSVPVAGDDRRKRKSTKRG
jgi:two-component system, chemotaxis family, chemotaxis protein CheY